MSASEAIAPGKQVLQSSDDGRICQVLPKRIDLVAPDVEVAMGGGQPSFLIAPESLGFLSQTIGSFDSRHHR